MNLIFHKHKELPKLAWAAILEKGKEDVNVFCGSWVETANDFFVEGAWDDNFSKGNFDESVFFMGSGGKLFKGKVKFCSPSHTLERLHFIKVDNKLYISNSLAFVLEISGSSLDINYMNYERDFASIVNGINNYKAEIPLQNGRKLNIIIYSNIIIDKEINVTKKSKNVKEDFSNFTEYYISLSSTLKRLKENANSKMRNVHYGVVSTISKGYDAAACAALGKEIGCNMVVSFNAPKKYADDCGEDIAQQLGYTNIIKKNANEYLNRKDFLEAEFLASGEVGPGIVFSAFEEHFEGRLVLEGLRGDKFWDKNACDVNRELKFKNQKFTSSAMLENRLRVGYIRVPIPFYGAANWPSIHEISNSEEMNSWSLKNNYDRPIPRRILEEKGVDRELFGMKKKGAGFTYIFDNITRIKKKMSSSSFDSFSNFYRDKRSIKRLLKNCKHVINFLRETFPIYINYILGKLRMPQINFEEEQTISNPFSPAYLIHWGIHITKSRYSLDRSETNQLDQNNDLNLTKQTSSKKNNENRYVFRL